MLGRAENVAAKQSVPGPGFHHDEPRRFFQQRPDVEKLNGQQRPKTRVHLRARVVIGQRRPVAARVVPAGPVQGPGHVLGKCDRPVPRNAAADGAFGRRRRAWRGHNVPSPRRFLPSSGGGFGMRFAGVMAQAVTLSDPRKRISCKTATGIRAAGPNLSTKEQR